jgi:hypothetical protein
VFSLGGAFESGLSFDVLSAAVAVASVVVAGFVTALPPAIWIAQQDIRASLV